MHSALYVLRKSKVSNHCPPAVQMPPPPPAVEKPNEGCLGLTHRLGRAGLLSPDLCLSPKCYELRVQRLSHRVRKIEWLTGRPSLLPSGALERTQGGSILGTNSRLAHRKHWDLRVSGGGMQATLERAPACANFTRKPELRKLLVWGNRRLRTGNPPRGKLELKTVKFTASHEVQARGGGDTNYIAGFQEQMAHW